MAEKQSGIQQQVCVCQGYRLTPEHRPEMVEQNMKSDFMEKRCFAFQKFGRREYIWAGTKEEALKIYKKKHLHDVSQVKSWVWDEGAQRFVVDRPGLILI